MQKCIDATAKLKDRKAYSRFESKYRPDDIFRPWENDKEEFSLEEYIEDYKGNACLIIIIHLSPKYISQASVYNVKKIKFIICQASLHNVKNK